MIENSSISRKQNTAVDKNLNRRERLRFSASPKIEICDQVFEKELFIECEDKVEILFSNCIFKSNFFLKKLNRNALPESQRCIIFENCRFERYIDFYNVGNARYYRTSIEFRNVDFTDIKLSECSVDEIIFRQTVGRMVSLCSIECLASFVSYSSRFESIDIALSQPNELSKVQLKESHINNYLGLSNFSIKNIHLNNKYLCSLHINDYTKSQLKPDLFASVKSFL